MRDLDWVALTGRHTSDRTMASGASQLAGKRVLVTGAAGCIGSALAQAILLSSSAQLVLIDKSEQGVYELERTFHEMQKAKGIVTLLGDICDATLLDDLFQTYQPQIVFHAAAFKHVPLLEQNPFAAIANNTIGTVNIVRRAVASACEQLILVSTDKAADPASIMGASKRIAEMIMMTLTQSQTKMKIVRLGNVLNSPGSIVPIFLEQVEGCVPMTITHADVRRYFITIEEAVAALLEVTRKEYESGLFVPEMGPSIRIVQVAKHIFQLLRPESLEGPEFVFIPLRPGDKLEEVLIAKDESWSTSSAPNKTSQVLRRVVGSAISEEAILAAVDKLRQAVSDRNLSQMTSAITELIPGYHPSALLSAQFNNRKSGATGVGR